MNSSDQPERSVFADVDQDEMIRRLSQAAADEVETTFFDEALQQPDTDASAHLEAGIRAFTGVEVSVPAASRTVEAPSGLRPPSASAPVVVDGPIGEDPAALRAFVLFGPAGVARPHVDASRRPAGIVRGLRRKGSTS